MAFYKKAFNKASRVYYPQAITQGKPVETKTIAKELALISTVSNSDVNAVLGDIASVMYRFMAQGKSVHIDGLGYFRFTLYTDGVTNEADFNFSTQMKSVRVQFTPERETASNGAVTRGLVDYDKIEWIELGADAGDSDDTPADDTPAEGGDTQQTGGDDQSQDPMG